MRQAYRRLEGHGFQQVHRSPEGHFGEGCNPNGRRTAKPETEIGRGEPEIGIQEVCQLNGAGKTIRCLCSAPFLLHAGYVE
jgi:hypothetical protein